MNVFPTEITDHRQSGVLEIAWLDGRVSRLPHGLLRERCRCGGCEQLRRSGAPVATADPGLRLAAIEPVGDKGLNLVFSDGHGRGIYPWAYLQGLAAEAAA
ncbi:MAG: DUF971 domain-containing protein [Rhizobacter sp.]|nr:DUF971 domain-containing protein [Rhizobacter sp.]